VSSQVNHFVMDVEREIPGARLLTLPQIAHQLPPAVWDVVIPAILEHTFRGR
jgi:hypothetical protein